MGEIVIQNKVTLQQADKDYFLFRDGQGVCCPIKAPVQQFNKLANAMETFIQPCNYLCALASLSRNADGKLFFVQRCGAGNAHEIQEVVAQAPKEKPALKLL